MLLNLAQDSTQNKILKIIGNITSAKKYSINCSPGLISSFWALMEGKDRDKLPISHCYFFYKCYLKNS